MDVVPEHCREVASSLILGKNSLAAKRLNSSKADANYPTLIKPAVGIVRDGAHSPGGGAGGRGGGGGGLGLG
jgi:hypothetical protein